MCALKDCTPFPPHVKEISQYSETVEDSNFVSRPYTYFPRPSHPYQSRPKILEVYRHPRDQTLVRRPQRAQPKDRRFESNPVGSFFAVPFIEKGPACQIKWYRVLVQSGALMLARPR